MVEKFIIESTNENTCWCSLPWSETRKKETDLDLWDFCTWMFHYERMYRKLLAIRLHLTHKTQCMSSLKPTLVVSHLRYQRLLHKRPLELILVAREIVLNRKLEQMMKEVCQELSQGYLSEGLWNWDFTAQLMLWKLKDQWLSFWRTIFKVMFENSTDINPWMNMKKARNHSQEVSNSASDIVFRRIDYISIIFYKQTKKPWSSHFIIPMSMPKVVAALSRSNELIQKPIYSIVYCFANKYLFLSNFRE